MDRERLGRVLGKGARLAARTAFEAVDAATAPAPAATSRTRQESAPPARPPSASRKAPAHFVAGVPLRGAIGAAKAGITAPLRRASRALWLELTGSFFALFALSFGLGVWHSRANALSSLPADRHRFYAFCALAVLFAYFAVSSFVRARRISR